MVTDLAVLPKVVVFDLDYTLWPCWCDTHISPPIKSQSSEVVVDKCGYELSFYKDVGEIMAHLQLQGVKIVGASRTCAPQVAKKLLKLLHLNGQPAINYFDHMEWGTFSKQNHIKSAMTHMRKQGIIGDDVQLHHVVLFDDELRNRDVETIGCLFVHIPSEEYGLTRSIFDNGMDKYRKKIGE